MDLTLAICRVLVVKLTVVLRVRIKECLGNEESITQKHGFEYDLVHRDHFMCKVSPIEWIFEMRITPQYSFNMVNQKHNLQVF